MTGRVIDGRDADQWLAMTRALTGRDPYFSLAYHRAFSVEAEPRAFVFENGGDRLFHPFLLHPITNVGGTELADRGWGDIESVYGYSGPIASSAESSFLFRAWRWFDDWCRDQHIVSEFIRFHPLLETRRFAHPSMTVDADRHTVLVPLDGSEDTLMRQAAPEHRNRLKKARSAGLRFIDVTAEPDGLARFLTIYRVTMRRVGASDFYDFSDRHMLALTAGLGDRWRIFLVQDDGRDIAGALFMISDTCLHYHLGGSLSETRKLAPNNLLFHEAALWAGRRGLGLMHLGGGRTNATDDALFRFKRRFNRNSGTYPTFYIGKRVILAEAYEHLLDLRQSKGDLSKSDGRLQRYRGQPRVFRSR